MHITERAPVLSATLRNRLHLNHLFILKLFPPQSGSPVLEPVWVENQAVRSLKLKTRTYPKQQRGEIMSLASCMSTTNHAYYQKTALKMRAFSITLVTRQALSWKSGAFLDLHESPSPASIPSTWHGTSSTWYDLAEYRVLNPTLNQNQSQSLFILSLTTRPVSVRRTVTLSLILHSPSDG